MGTVCKDVSVHHFVFEIASASNQEKFLSQSTFLGEGTPLQLQISNNKPCLSWGTLNFPFPLHNVFQGKLPLGLITEALRLQPRSGEELYWSEEQDLLTYFPRHFPEIWESEGSRKKSQVCISIDKMQSGKTAGPSTSKGYPLYPSVPKKRKIFIKTVLCTPKYTIFFSIPSTDPWLSELSNLLIFQGRIFFLRVMNTICAT